MSADNSELAMLIVDLEGADERLTAEVSTILRKGIFDVVAEAQRLVPVDTGATRQSITASAEGTDQPPQPGDLAVEAGPTTFYSPFLEYGTVKMSPRPFMGPAFDATVPDVVSALEQAAEKTALP